MITIKPLYKWDSEESQMTYLNLYHKILNFRDSNLKLAVSLQILTILSLNVQMSSNKLKITQENYHNLPNLGFRGIRPDKMSFELDFQNPEYRNNPENFYLCRTISFSGSLVFHYVGQYEYLECVFLHMHRAS